MPIICRICEQEIPTNILKEHSFKCKEFHDKRDLLVNLKNCISHKVEIAFMQKNELAKEIKLLLIGNDTQEDSMKIDDLVRKIKLLKKIVQYGDRISRIGSTDYDTRRKMVLF